MTYEELEKKCKWYEEQAAELRKRMRVYEDGKYIIIKAEDVVNLRYDMGETTFTVENFHVLLEEHPLHKRIKEVIE